MLGVVAPEIPAAGLFLVSLVAFFAWLMLLGLRFGIATPIAALLRWMGKKVSWIPFVGGITESAIFAATQFVDDALANAALAVERVGVRFLHDAFKITVWVADSLYDLADATASALETLVTHTIPAAVKAVGHPIAQRLDGIDARIRSVEREALAELRVGIDRLTRRGEQLTRALEARIAAATGALAGKVAGELGDVRGWVSGELGTFKRTVNRRLTKTEEAVGIAALTGTVLAIIARRMPWFRCSNVGKFGKGLCKADTRFVDGLLDGAILLASAISIVELAKECQDFTDEVEAGIRFFVKEIK